MAWVRHVALEPEEVETVVLPDRKFSTIEVMNVTGAGEVYFLVLRERDAATDPALNGDDCEILPATICALEVDAPDDTPITVKAISADTVSISVRAE